MAVAPETTEPKPAPEGQASKPSPGAIALDYVKKFLALREGSIIVVTVVAILYFSVDVTHFFTGSNFKNLLPYFCFLAIMAAGQVFVMTLGEIDLSVGAVYLFTPFMYWKLTTAGIPLVPSVILAVAIAGVIGAINGFFTAYVGIASFVATLAMLFFLDGLSLIMSHSEEITTPGTSITKIPTFAQVFGAGTYSELIWALGIVVILQLALSFTRWGVYTVAVGGNKLGAQEAGINIKRVLLRNFILCAMTAGFAGILEAVRTSSMTPDPSGSNQFLLYSIAAVIIGGTLMTGGEGTIVGALLGALFIGVLEDGLTLKSVPATYEYLWIGIAVIVAMVLYVLVRQIRREPDVPDQPHAAGSVVGPSTAEDDVLRVDRIAKRFGPIIALRDVSLHLRKGEVLGLLGDNGAGKSTLVKIICGFHKPDSGTMWLKGEPYTPKSVDDARAHGVDTVYQDLALIDELSAYQNLFLRREQLLKPSPFLSNRAMRKQARSALDEIGINIPRIDLPVARLSGGQRQAIAVARTVSGGADILLLDEPLAAMGAKEGAQILDLIARLKKEGRVSIVMILHNYEQVFLACDRVNLIQDGAISLDKPTSETSVEELTEIVVEEYRRARLAQQAANAATA